MKKSNISKGEDNTMKKEYDFSKAVQGKFYRPIAKLEIPVYLDKEVKEFFFDVDKFSRIAGSAQKLIYGSDWPFYSLKEYVRVAESLPFSEEEKELFFWKNAANLFGIN